MAGNSFGKLFSVTTCGESHGGVVAAIVDGCPPGLSLVESDIQQELDRRKPGQSHLTTTRSEQDQVQILSGVFEDRTLGTPILLVVKNGDARSEDYHALKDLFRASHADFTYEKKYGVRDWRGGGRASARETVARVAAGAIAKKILLEDLNKIEIVAFVESVKDIAGQIDRESVTREAVEGNIMRCPDGAAASRMIRLVEEVRAEGDSVGGVIGCVIRNVPAGLGEPVFDKLQADLAKAMLSINAVKGFEIGAGFEGTKFFGSEQNDQFFVRGDGSVATHSNNSGGVQGGISNGMPIVFRVAFKPVPTIAKPQKTLNRHLEEVIVEPSGRHDPCVLPRAVPVVEAMAALVVVDHLLRNKR